MNSSASLNEKMPSGMTIGVQRLYCEHCLKRVGMSTVISYLLHGPFLWSAKSAVKRSKNDEKFFFDADKCLASRAKAGKN